MLVRFIIHLRNDDNEVLKYAVLREGPIIYSAGRQSTLVQIYIDIRERECRYNARLSADTDTLTYTPSSNLQCIIVTYQAYVSKTGTDIGIGIRKLNNH